MDAARETNDEQTERWNGVAGHAWVEAQELLDRMFKPFEDALVEAVLAEPRGRVLDVGCGTGGVALAVARALGAESHCVGVDISGPMITAARARAEREDTTASFIRADAQLHAFEPAGFDMIVSRFGVMFFDDPVGAFGNRVFEVSGGAATPTLLRAAAWTGESPAEAGVDYSSTQKKRGLIQLLIMPFALLIPLSQFGFTPTSVMVCAGAWLFAGGLWALGVTHSVR